MTRFGIGYDVHRLTADRKLILDGVEIPHEPGLEAHSDGDVLIHAIITMPEDIWVAETFLRGENK